MCPCKIRSLSTRVKSPQANPLSPFNDGYHLPHQKVVPTLWMMTPCTHLNSTVGRAILQLRTWLKLYFTASCHQKLWHHSGWFISFMDILVVYRIRWVLGRENNKGLRAFQPFQKIDSGFDIDQPTNPNLGVSPSANDHPGLPPPRSRKERM